MVGVQAAVLVAMEWVVLGGIVVVAWRIWR